MRVDIYTDGSCLRNPGPGGFCALLVENSKIINTITGREPRTTNNAMELKAAIEGLNLSQNSSPTVELRSAKLITDSRYVYMGCTEWIWNWKENDWKVSSGRSVKNKDLWKQILPHLTNIPLEFELVRGHSGVKFNERADKIASLMSEKQKEINNSRRRKS